MANNTIIVNDINSIDVLKQVGISNRYGDWEINFLGIKLNCKDILSLYTAIKDIFIQEIYNFHASTDTPFIIDGGAHIGLFSIYAKKKYPKARIIAFEPDENNLELLMSNLLSNGIRDVQVIPAGLYENDGELSFFSRPSDGSSIFASDTNSIIKTKRLSPYLHQHVDMLKLNIEGAEWSVLKECGSHLKNVQQLTLEYHGFPELGQSLHNILALLDSNSFRYSIHDYDSHTNPATKPPKQLTSQSRFYLLVNAVHDKDNSYHLKNYKGLGDILRTEPLSKKFGLDIGTSICRYYIDSFMKQNKLLITGRILEIADNIYTVRYGKSITKSDILHVKPTPRATIIGNLETGDNIPDNAFDCIILTQTLQCIFDHEAVLKNCYKALKPGGALLLTTTGLGQISRYDMDRWGEYWRFTDKCLDLLLQKYFPQSHVKVQTYGNVASAKAYLDGMPAEHLPSWTLEYSDNDYQILVAGVATKPTANTFLDPTEVHATTSRQQSPRILMYHRVDNDPVDAQMLCVSPSNFENHLAVLRKHRNVLPLHELVRLIKKGHSAPNTVSITFDDGYLDNLTNALPLLEKYQTHATVFVCAGSLGAPGGLWGDQVEYIFLSGRPLPPSLSMKSLKRDWPTQTPIERIQAHDEFRALLRQATPKALNAAMNELAAWAHLTTDEYFTRPILSTTQLKQIAASPYIEIGCHAMSHGNLARMTPEQQRQEISQGKMLLENIIRKEISLFAYPYGTKDSFTQTTCKIIDSYGFTAALAVTQTDVDLQSVNMLSLQRRVVRDWGRASFTQWLDTKDQLILEQKTIHERTDRLLRTQQAQTNTRKASEPGHPLRIVYINTHDIAGGAAKSTWRLAKAQRTRGHRTDTIVRHKKSDHPNVHKFDPSADHTLTTHCLENGLLFYQYQGSHALLNNDIVKKADVLHLQNLHGDYFNPYSVALLSNFRPVVWTLRDMQSFTGHCAHSFDCDRWITGCGECPNISIEPSLRIDSTSRLWRDKRDIYTHSKLVIVCPSRWIKEKVEQSILKEQRIEIVCNGVDTSIYQPHDRIEARRTLGLPLEATLVGAVAHGGSLSNQWKGGSYTIKALELLWKDHPNLIFVNIGSSGNDRHQHKNIIHIQHIQDETTLAKLYSALDVYIYTPLADTCPLVVIEALSCGLPVVSFATGGIPELVRHEIDGFLVENRDIKLLKNLVSLLIKKPAIRHHFSAEARKGALERFDIKNIAHRYEDIYRDAIQSFWSSKPINLLLNKSIPAEIMTPTFKKYAESLVTKN